MAGNTFTWFGGTGSGQTASNWSPSGPPGSGDTVVVNSGTVQLTNVALSGNTIDLNAGTLEFIANTTSAVSSFDTASVVLAGASANAAIDFLGAAANAGTIAAVGNTVTLAIAASGTIPGTLTNTGLVEVSNGATLDIVGQFSDANGGAVLVNGGTVFNTASFSAESYTLTSNSAANLLGAGSGQTIVFAGTNDVVRFTPGATAATGTIMGFGLSDTIDTGISAAIGTVVYDFFNNGGTAGSVSPPMLILYGTTGTELFSAYLADSNGNPIGDNTGTFTPTLLTSGTLAAGSFEIGTAPDGFTTISELPPSTWQFIAPNFTLLSGPGNQSGSPRSGDTVIANDQTFVLRVDNNLTGNTIDLLGTSDFSFAGDFGSGTGTAYTPGISLSRPTLDQTSVIVAGGTSVGATTLNFDGISVNQGTVAAAGLAGSVVVLNVDTYVSSGTQIPGVFVNYGELLASAGNSLTIAAGAGAEFFNAGRIFADGGSVLITAAAGAVTGGYAPTSGIAAIGAGGTLEQATGFPAGTDGSPPFYVFADNAAGNTLKIDNPAAFSGRIVNFQAGDTIDLGSLQTVSTIVALPDGRVQIQNGTSILETLVFATGNFITNTLTAATGASGHTILTTAAVNPSWTGSSGVWQTGSLWSTGSVPGANDAASVGFGATAPFVLTTGSAPVSVGSLTEANSNASLRIVSDTTVGAGSVPGNLIQIGGSLEVAAGNTLTTPLLRQLTTGSDLTVDAGAVLYIQGRDNPGFANAGSITVQNGNSLGLFVDGTAVVDGLLFSANLVNAGSTVTSGGLISIGQDAGGTPATMLVQGGTVVDTYSLLSSGPSSFGSLVLNGTATVWNDAGDATDTANTRGYMLIGVNNQAGTIPLSASAGQASLLIENGATLVEATGARIGASADSTGSVMVQTGGQWIIGTAASGGFLTVGDAANASGTLDVVGGSVSLLSGTGSLTVNGTASAGNLGMVIGGNAGSGGIVSVQDGSLTVAGAGLSVGSSGSGVLDVLNQGMVSLTAATGGLKLGQSFGATGSLLVSGVNAQVNIAGGSMKVGQGGSGVVQIQNGGMVQDNGSGGLLVGQSASASGTVLVDGGGVLNVAGSGGIAVGVSASSSGLLDVNGGQVTNSGLGMVVGNAGSGVVWLENGGLMGTTGTAAPNVVVGAQATGAGTILVQTYGSLLLGEGNLFVGGSAGAVGTVDVTGFGAAVIQQAGISLLPVIAIGFGGNGVLSVASGATVATAGYLSIGGQSGTAAVAGGSGIVTVDGGTIVTSGVTTVADATLAAYGIVLGQGSLSTGMLQVGAGGIVVANATSGSGGVAVGEVAGATGSIDVNGGFLQVSGGSLLIGQGGTGIVSVENGGTIVAGGGNAGAVGLGGQAGGMGSLAVQAGGQFILNNVGLNIGDAAGAAGAVTVTGSLSALQLLGGGSLPAPAIEVGLNGTGTLSVLNGASAAAAGNIVIGDALGAGSSGHGTVIVGGTGSLSVGSASVLTAGGAISLGQGSLTTGSLQIGAGSAVDVTGSVVAGGTASGPSGGAGTIVVNGSLEVTGPLMVWSGSTLAVSGTASGVTVGTSVPPGGHAAAGQIEIFAGQTLGGNGLIVASSVLNEGQIQVSGQAAVSTPGTMEITSAVTGTGTIDLLSGSVLRIDTAGGLGQQTVFGTGGTETLILNYTTSVPAGMSSPGSISGLAAGDRIELAGASSIVSARFTASGTTVGQDQLTIQTNTGSFVIGSVSLASNVAASLTTFFDSTSGAYGVTVESTLCFLPDTLIATPSGEVKVQALRTGDMVLTAGGDARPIAWIGQGKVLATRGRRSAATPVIVRRGALGNGVPHRDLHVTKGHSLFIDDVLIPVEFLVNHRSVLWDDRAQEVNLFHIELETHDVLLANGAPAESYRDDGNRWLFQNANDGWNQPPKEPCAPVLTGGPVVDAAWRRLLDAAGPRPGIPLTDEPDLHLLADGVRLDAARSPGRYVFRLNTVPGDLRLVSRSAAPAELGLARDPRELGVAVRRLEIWHGHRLTLLEADDVRLRDGFHGFEPACGHRWTNGDATVPPGLVEGPADIVVHVSGTAHYPETGEAVEAA